MSLLGLQTCHVRNLDRYFELPFSMRMFTGMTLVCYKSSELDATIVAPIWSNPEYCLEQPIDCSCPVSPGNVVALASGTYMMFRDPLHPESLSARAWRATPGAGPVRRQPHMALCDFATGESVNQCPFQRHGAPKPCMGTSIVSLM